MVQDLFHVHLKIVPDKFGFSSNSSYLCIRLDHTSTRYLYIRQKHPNMSDYQLSSSQDECVPSKAKEPRPPFSERYATISQVEYARLTPKFLLGEEVYFFSNKGFTKGKVISMRYNEFLPRLQSDPSKISLTIFYELISTVPQEEDDYEFREGRNYYNIPEETIFRSTKEMVDYINTQL